MTILLINNNLYEINETNVDVYDIATGESTATQQTLNQLFNLPIETIDAALNWGNGNIYFFKEDKYYKYDIANNECAAGYPLPIADNWKGIADNVWACVRRQDKAYFFNEKQYTRYDCATDTTDENYPLVISENWKDIPETISGIVMLNDATALIQNDSDYYLYDWENDAVINNNGNSLGNVLAQNINSGGGGSSNSSELETMEKEATEIIATIKSKNNIGTSLGGDSAGGKKIGNFPDWFGQLQDMLTQSIKWGDDEEKAQQLLQRYVNYYYSSNNKTMPPNVAVFIKYIGRGEANKNANQKLKGTPNAGELGAVSKQDEDAHVAKRYQWCQAASSSAVNIALKNNGYTLNTGSLYSESWYKASADRIITGKAAHTSTLEGGDMFSVVSNKTALSGHVMTAMEDDGTTILAVSGNAGGKAIRIETVKRGTPPTAFNWGNYFDDKKPKQPGINQPIENGVVWVVSIQKTSLLNRLESTDADELTKVGLKKL